MGCEAGPSKFYGGVEEGVITYRVTYPYANTDGLMAAFLPEEMRMKFEENRYMTEISSAKVFKNAFFADREDSMAIQGLKLMNKKVRVTMNKREVKELLEGFPEMTVFHSRGRDTIAGYPCKKAIAIFSDIDKPSVQVYYTDRIAIDDPNWCNQYRKIGGVLMGYEIERFGVRMRLRARKVEPRTVKEEEFKMEGYKEVSMEEMEKELKEIMETFDL